LDWLTRHKVTIDYERKLVTFSASDEEGVTFKGSGHQMVIPTVFAIQVFKMLKKRRLGYLCAIEATKLKDLDLSKNSSSKKSPDRYFKRYRGYHPTEELSLP